MLNAASGAFGATRSDNASDAVALRATFAGGTQAMLIIAVP